MNQKTILIGAGVILVLIAAIFYSTGFFTSAENEFDLPCDDDNLQIKSKIDLSLLFADGSRETVTGSLGEPLAVEYEGVEVTQVEWKLSCKVDTPTGKDAYEEVRVTSTPVMDADYTGDATEDLYLQTSCNYGTQEVWQQTYYQSNVNTFIMYPDSGVWKTVLFQVIELDDVFAGVSEPGIYYFIFAPGGFASYRGESQYGNGEWQDVDFFDQGMNVGYELDYINEEASVSFDAEVEWL